MSIRSELEAPLVQYGIQKNIPVALENKKFTKPSTGSYLEILLLSTHSINRDVAAKGVRTYGKAQINVYSELGTGMGLLESLADEVKNLYPVIPKLGIVSIEKPCDEGDTYVSGNFMCLPITVSYRVET
jgi:hypothetical protein